MGTAPEVAAHVRVASARVGLPVEIAWTGETLLVNPPRWRWRTDFDDRPGRLLVHLHDIGGDYATP
jgi:hypothetical protein